MDHGHALHLARANQDMFLANLQVKKHGADPPGVFMWVFGKPHFKLP